MIYQRIPVGLFYLGLATLLSWTLWCIMRGHPEPLFFLSVGYLVWESSVTAILITISGCGVSRLVKEEKSGHRSWPGLPATELIQTDDSPAEVSVLISAYNEAGSIVETIHSVLSQSHSAREIIVASDGSEDGMNQLLIEKFHLSPTSIPGQFSAPVSPYTELILLTLPRRGKGWALNSAITAATREIVVTLDADTKLEPNALGELCRPFNNSLTVAAGGFILVGNATNKFWITSQQYVEYLKNFLYRIGFAQAQTCLQVSGAFGAFRRQLLLDVGGFNPQSLVEDYEIIYRLHRVLLDRGTPYRITIAPQAVAYTDGPESIGAFIRQRTRWFAGFLQTLWDYSFMIFNPRYGRIGLFMLPVKSIDAVVPIWGLGSITVLIISVLSGHVRWSHIALILFFSKWLLDIGLNSLTLSWLTPLFPQRILALSRGRMAFCIMTEGLFFHWFRQAAVLNSYGWILLRIRRWEQARWHAVKA